jgi:hypothetical protein
MSRVAPARLDLSEVESLARFNSQDGLQSKNPHGDGPPKAFALERNHTFPCAQKAWLRVKGDLQLSAGRNGELVCRGHFGWNGNFDDSIARGAIPNDECSGTPAAAVLACKLDFARGIKLEGRYCATGELDG